MNITIISPKNSFPGLPQFKRIDLAKTSFGLTPPEKIGLEDFIFEFIPILGSLWGLIYGIEMLMQAAEIALLQYQHFVDATGKSIDLCIKDIAEALRLVKAGGYRKAGYKDAAQTALGLLLGKLNLFACRKGISFKWLSVCVSLLSVIGVLRCLKGSLDVILLPYAALGISILVLLVASYFWGHPIRFKERPKMRNKK